MQSTSLEAGRDETSHLTREPLMAQDEIPQLADAHMDAFLRAHQIDPFSPSGTNVTRPATQEFPWNRSYLKDLNGGDQLHYSSTDSVIVFSIYRGNVLEGTGFKHTIYDLNRKAMPRNSVRLGRKFEFFAATTGITKDASPGQNGHEPALPPDASAQIETPTLAEPIELKEGVLRPV